MTQREIDKQLEWLARGDRSMPPIPDDDMDLMLSRMEVINLPASPRHIPRSSPRSRPAPSISSLNFSNMTIDQPASDHQRIMAEMDRLEREEEEAEIRSSARRSNSRHRRSGHGKNRRDHNRSRRRR